MPDYPSDHPTKRFDLGTIGSSNPLSDLLDYIGGSF